MTDQQCVEFLQWALPRLRMRWPGFRKVRRQVHKRIDRRMGELGLSEVADYRAYLESNPDEWSVLDAFCRISISRFYRDRGVFDYVGEQLLPGLAQAAIARGEPDVHAWCAGCASGEEAYTLSILWRRCVRPRYPRIDFRLVATDVDRQLLDRAHRAAYSASSLKEVPPGWLEEAFTPQGEDYVLRPEFAAGVELLQQDIRSEMPAGPFRLVLCRNLAFTYFDEELQREILGRIYRRLTADGVLVIGRKESPRASRQGCISREECRRWLNEPRPSI